MINAGTKEVLRLKYEFHEPRDNVIFVKKKKKFKEPKQKTKKSLKNQNKKKWKVKEERIENVKFFASFVHCDGRTFSFVHINKRQSQEY